MDRLCHLACKVADYADRQLDATILLLIQLHDAPLRLGDDFQSHHTIARRQVVEQWHHGAIDHRLAFGRVRDDVGVTAEMHRSAVAVRGPESARKEREHQAHVVPRGDLQCRVDIWKEEVVQTCDGAVVVELQPVAAVAEDAPFHHRHSLRGHIREVRVDLLVCGGIAHP